jgi:hypothetical protein
MKLKNQTKKDWLILSLVPLLFAAMLWGIVAIQSSDIRQFRTQGIESSAIVVDKFTTRSSSTDSRDHNFSVTFMAGGDGDDDNIVNVGEFSRANFEVGSRTYDKTDVGDTITILYLPDDSSEVRLKSTVDNYSATILWIVIWLLVATAVFFWVAAIFAPKSLNGQHEKA